MALRATLKLPREHGAWAMLYVPFATGVLVAGSVSWAILLLGLSATSLFIARESMLAWRRASFRGRDSDGPARTMLVYLGLAVLFGAPLVLLHRLYGLLPMALIALVLLGLNLEQAMRRQERTVLAEISSVIGLTLTAPAAYYTARATLDAKALWLWAFCTLYFTSSVFYVKLRVLTARARREEARRKMRLCCAFYHLFMLACLLVLGLTGSLDLLALIAFAPIMVRAFWHLIRPIRQLNLRRVGVLEVLYSLLFLLFVTLSFRAA